MSRKAITAKEPPATGAAEGDYLSVRETAALLKLSEISIRRFLTKKKLRRFKIGARTLILKSQALGLIHEGE